MSLLPALVDGASHLLAQTVGGSRAGSSGSGGGDAHALILVSFIKPPLVLAAVLGWAWVVATIYDKDAQRWYFKRSVWNLAHLAAALVAVAAFVLSPSFLIGFPALVAILGADLVAYYVMRNRDDRVPAAHKWSLKALASYREGAKSRKEQKLARGVTLELVGPRGPVRAPEKGTPEFDIRIATEAVLIDAIERRASEVEIVPKSEAAYGLAFLVDGVAQQGEALPKAQAVAVISVLKAAAGLDIEDFRRKQQGDMEVGMSGARQRVRVIASGGASGVRAQVRFDPDAQGRFTVDKLGLLEAQSAEVATIVQDGLGVVLVSSPSRSGRTATLYALAKQHDAYISNIQTLEVEPAGAMEGVRHNKFDPAADGPDYAATLRSILRRDPDVVVVGDMPDAATAQEIAKADHERARVYAALRADSALAAIQTYAKAVGDPKAAAAGLHGVTCQRLIRKLCTNCRVEYPPPADMLQKLGVPAGKAPSTIFRKGGRVLVKNKEEVCPLCQGAGYFGQEGVFEVFGIGDEERSLLAKGDLSGLRSALRKKRLPFIQEVAVQKLLQGVTSVEEVVRISSSGKSSSSSSSKRASPGAKPSAAAKPAQHS
jgi:type II secretory ATPase GspE/PulE/Tfp pilus assembly ATPase PilB-like protein